MASSDETNRVGDDTATDLPGERADDTATDLPGERADDTATDLPGERADDDETTGPAPDSGPPVRYLSLDWIRALSAEVAASDHLAEIAEQHTIGVTQVVTDGPEGDVTYHLDVRDGAATFGPGPAEPQDVKMQQTWDTAVAVATGTLNAQEAFINGHIMLFGDQQKLMDAGPVFGALDAVFATVRDRTRYE